MNRVDKIFEKTGQNAAQFSKEYTDYLCELLRNLDHDVVAKVANEFLATRQKKKKIIFMGNGGSAATASHFANDLSIGPRNFTDPFRAMSISDNVPVMTALANDMGYEEIFVKQLQVLGEKEDLAIVISASGNSPNLVRAVEYAKSSGIKTVGLLGFDGGKLESMVDIPLTIKTAKGEYGPVEDLHMVLDHLISNYLMRVIGKS